MVKRIMTLSFSTPFYEESAWYSNIDYIKIYDKKPSLAGGFFIAILYEFSYTIRNK